VKRVADAKAAEEIGVCVCVCVGVYGSGHPNASKIVESQTSVNISSS
jgi:hypothetical protein